MCIIRNYLSIICIWFSNSYPPPLSRMYEPKQNGKYPRRTMSTTQSTIDIIMLGTNHAHFFLNGKKSANISNYIVIPFLVSINFSDRMIYHILSTYTSAKAAIAMLILMLFVSIGILHKWKYSNS